jgi:hypothetical protein
MIQIEAVGKEWQEATPFVPSQLLDSSLLGISFAVTSVR